MAELAAVLSDVKIRRCANSRRRIFTFSSPKKFPAPSEGAAEGGGWGEEFRRARASEPRRLLC